MAGTLMEYRIIATLTEDGGATLDLEASSVGVNLNYTQLERWQQVRKIADIALKQIEEQTVRN